MPPHNLQAEESVLGALLLSRDAIGAVSEQGLRPEDFYRPAHQHIFDAVRALYSTGAPADTITVADELRRNGLLEQVGGTEALHVLQNATPAISNAAHYARIVQDTALLRRLIHVAGDIAEMAYSEPDDVTKAVDDAESKVFKVAEDRVTDSTQLLSESIKAVMDRLEETYARGDSITGTATGYHDIDELLSGLQPSTLNIVGARPAMGKCVAWDTPMVDVATGDVVTARELSDRAAARGALAVRGLDGHGRAVHARRQHVRRRRREARVPAAHRVGPGGDDHRVTPAAHAAWLAARGRPRRRRRDRRAGGPAGVRREDASSDELGRLAATAADRGVLDAAAFRLVAPTLAALVGRLFAIGGTVRVDGPSAGIRFAAPSEALMGAVAHALLRLGVRSVQRRHRAPGGLARHDVEVVEPASIVRFADVMPVPELADVLARARAVAAAATAPRAPLPVEVWDDIDKARGELPWADAQRAPRARPGRSLACASRQACRATRSPRSPPRSTTSSCGGGRRRTSSGTTSSRSRRPGPTEVVDFTVPTHHNFVAADLYLHNTAFGLGMAVHVAQTTAKPVLVFSLEMGHNELTQRILSSEATVDSSKMRNGRISEADWGLIGRAIGRLEVPLFLDDNPRVTVMEIRAKARRMKARHGGLALIVIDYLQLMSGNGNPENRQLEVSEISRSLKILARELEVPIVALSQLSRNLESRADKRPMLSDLRESGSLEQDADVVMFLYRDEVYNAESPDKGSAEVIVAKHRSGPIGTKRLVYLGQYTRFDNAAAGCEAGRCEGGRAAAILGACSSATTCWRGSCSPSAARCSSATWRRSCDRRPSRVTRVRWSGRRCGAAC